MVGRDTSICPTRSRRLFAASRLRTATAQGAVRETKSRIESKVAERFAPRIRFAFSVTRVTLDLQSVVKPVSGQESSSLWIRRKSL